MEDLEDLEDEVFSHSNIIFTETETMDSMYADGSEHKACIECGFCIDCGDCARFGCGT